MANEIGIYAAERMRYYCDSDIMGYDQSQRENEYETDCSQLVLRCYDEALRHYGFDGLDTSGYTGNMCSICQRAGATIYNYDGNLSDLDVGDAVVNEGVHTEMYVGNGQFGGANQDENGNISGGQPGDQTGREVYVKNSYQYGWDKVISWANFSVGDSEPVEEPEPQQEPQRGFHDAGGDFQVAYQVQTDDGVWHEWMVGEYDTGGSGDTFAGNNKPIISVRAKLVVVE